MPKTIAVVPPPPAPTPPAADPPAGPSEFRTSLMEHLYLPPEKKEGVSPSEPPPAPASSSTVPSGTEPGTTPAEPPAPPAEPETPPAAKADGEGEPQAPVDPRDQLIATLQKQLADNAERLKKLESASTPPKPTGPKTLNDFTHQELVDSIAYFANPENNVENAPVMIAEASAELARRAGETKATEVLNKNAASQQAAAWAQKARQDFPEGFDEHGRVLDNEFSRIAAGAYDAVKGLKERPDGLYVAAQYAWGVLERQKAAKNKAAPTTPSNTNGNGKAPQGNPPKLPPRPAAIRGNNPSASGPPLDAKTEKDQKTQDALERYNKSKRREDLMDAIKNRLAPRQ